MSLAVLDFETVSHSGNFLVQLLEQQQQLTAVERFAQKHESTTLPVLESHYRELLPLSKPAAGEQYAFEVDLDACSGCKACVTACHSLNGLEPTETWRSVGLLHGGSHRTPAVQHVTSACHHCIDPACLAGCPVKAYEKDPETGIVRHLDDQCIGCKYCIFKCPYDVPKFSYSKGIVRKCDMCHQRLNAGEAPACVQSCPNQAIRITLVRQQEVVEAAQANSFLTGAPGPQYTLPTTVYQSRRGMPRNMLPADFFHATPQHAHLPLVWMLVLTQMAVGAVMINYYLQRQTDDASLRSVHAIAAVILSLVGLSAATFHLGRPQYAYRALLGWKTSWMSREIIAFGIFPLAAIAYASAEYFRWNTVAPLLSFAATLSGAIAVWCSAMIYSDTQRPFWNASATNIKFFGTSIILGIPVSLIILLCGWQYSSGMQTMNADLTRHLLQAMLCAAAVKLASEFSIFWTLRDRAMTPLKRTALLLKRELASVLLARSAAAIVGMCFLPLILLVQLETITIPYRFTVTFSVVALSLVLSLLGEILERYLFFAAVVAPKMPGGQAS